MINCHSLKFFRKGYFFVFKFEKDNIKFGPHPICDQFLIFVKVFYTSLHPAKSWVSIRSVQIKFFYM